jgi:hypothetical protein
MASVFETFKNGGRGEAESTLIASTFSGAHFFNIVADVELDNGNVVAYPDPTNWSDNDTFKAVAPTAKDEIVLHLTAVKLYEEYTKSFQNEDNFYLGIGEIGRGYEIAKGDRFSVSAACFDENAVPEVGKYVVVKDGTFKLDISDTDKSDTNAFVGYILHKQPNGKFTIFVKKNHAE